MNFTIMKQIIPLILIVLNFISTPTAYTRDIQCYFCKSKILGEYVQIDSNKAHPNCFVCEYCSKPITSEFIIDNSKYYHEPCYRNSILLKCDVCLLPIEHSYLEDAWGNVYHSKHENEGKFCNSCGRLISAKITKGGFQFNDGRFICTPCAATMVEDLSSINDSKQSVLLQLNEKYFTGIPSNVPVILVNKNKLSEKSGNVHHSDLKGFTHTEIEILNDILISKKYTIYILFGLPQTEFEAVLAHEYLHIWIQEHDIEMHSSIVEGVCNLGSMIIYENDKTQFSKIQLEIMMKDPSVDYGNGYRIMKNRVKDLGWDKLINSILK